MTRLIDFLVCEDAREEKSGKWTIVGAYPDGIAIGTDLTERPIFIPRLAIFARMMFDADQPMPDNFQVRCLMAGTEAFRIRGAMEVRNPLRPVTMPLVSDAPIALTVGDLEFELTFSRGEEVVAVLRPDKMPVVVEAKR